MAPSKKIIELERIKLNNKIYIVCDYVFQNYTTKFSDINIYKKNPNSILDAVDKYKLTENTDYIHAVYNKSKQQWKISKITVKSSKLLFNINWLNEIGICIEEQSMMVENATEIPKTELKDDITITKNDTEIQTNENDMDIQIMKLKENIMLSELRVKQTEEMLKIYNECLINDKKMLEMYVTNAKIQKKIGSTKICKEKDDEGKDDEGKDDEGKDDEDVIYKNGYDEGYNEGYNEGYKEKCKEHCDDDNQSNITWTSTYDHGFKIGYHEGYIEGCVDGLKYEEEQEIAEEEEKDEEEEEKEEDEEVEIGKEKEAEEEEEEDNIELNTEDFDEE